MVGLISLLCRPSINPDFTLIEKREIVNPNINKAIQKAMVTKSIS